MPSTAEKGSAAQSGASVGEAIPAGGAGERRRVVAVSSGDAAGRGGWEQASRGSSLGCRAHFSAERVLPQSPLAAPLLQTAPIDRD